MNLPALYLTAAGAYRLSAATVGHSDREWRSREIRQALEFVSLARRHRLYHRAERAALLTASDFD